MTTNPEPWSPSAREHAAAGKTAIDNLADSLATRRLVAKIKRYIAGDFCGHAVLVAGHRGAGKTTAMLAAMQQVYNEQREADRACRPLLVRLHGPSLLVPGPANGPANGPTSAPTSPPAVTPSSAQYYSLRLLQEMAAGIFPAIAQELRWLLEGTIANENKRDDLNQVHAQETITHLIDELSRGLSLAELRELFRRLKLLPGGLLRNNGFAELTAINAACEAYLVVTGTLDTSNEVERQDHSKNTRTVKLTMDSTLGKALSPVAAALTATVGLASDHPIAALLSAAIILVGGSTLSNDSTRTRSIDATRKRTFTRDNSLESLVRRVPLLVDQLRSVGFPPVFMVDELDKIYDPPVHELIDGLMRNIKSYVTERSLICFLVDHQYYQRIMQAPVTAHGRNAAGAADTAEEQNQDEHEQIEHHRQPERYSVEHTFFGDWIYVVSTPADLHQYARRILNEDDDTDEQDLPAHRRTLQRRSLAFFRHWLIHRGQLHPYDVRRELERAHDTRELDRAKDSPSQVMRTPSMRIEVFLQLCIEWVLCESSQQREVELDPYYMQIVYDALYDVTDRWRAGQRLRRERDTEYWIADRTKKASQRTLAKHALNAMHAYIHRPLSLLDDIRSELDEVRLDLYLLSGEEDPETYAIDRAKEELEGTPLHGRSIERLAKALAAVKFELVRELATRLRTIVDFNKGEPQIDPSGQPVGRDIGAPSRYDPPPIEKTVRDRIDRLLELRQCKVIDQVGLDRLLSIATNDSLAPLLDAKKAYEALGNKLSPNHRTNMQHYAKLAPEAERVMLALLVGMAILTRTRDEDDPPQKRATTPAADVLERLGRSITGVEIAERLRSARKIVTRLCELQGLQLPRALEHLLDEDSNMPPAEIDQRLDTSNIPDSADESLREHWTQSLASRIAQRAAGQSIASLTSEGDILDIIAKARGWFPAPLRIWLEQPDPSAWTIDTWSEIMLSEQIPRLIRAVAAAYLNVRETLMKLLHDGTEVWSTEVREWLARKLDALKHRRLPLVVLVNPSTIMKHWMPILGCELLAIEVEDLDARARALSRALVAFEEHDTRVSRPAAFERNQYAVIRDGDTSGGWAHLEDGTVVLIAPSDLKAAIQQYDRALSSVRRTP
ncbi:MAG: hypothetical protein AAGF11_30935 [Myxococcota bacterium]